MHGKLKRVPYTQHTANSAMRSHTNQQPT